METCGERRYAADLVAFPDTDCCRRLGYIRAAAGILDFFTLFFPRHNEREQCRLTFLCQILSVCMLGSESCLSRLKSTLPLVLSSCSSSRSPVMAVELAEAAPVLATPPATSASSTKPMSSSSTTEQKDDFSHLAHHLNTLSRSRGKSPLKDILQYMAIDGMISLAGGTSYGFQILRVVDDP